MDENTSPATLSQEVTSLAREVRRMRWTNRALILLAAVGLATGLTRAAGTSGALEASRFVLLDGTGTQRAVLGFAPNGSVVLTFYRPDGSKALSLGEQAQAFPLR